MDNKDRIIEKQNELIGHLNKLCGYLLGNIENGKDNVFDLVMNVKSSKIKQVESELASLEREKEEVITPSPIRRAKMSDDEIHKNASDYAYERGGNYWYDALYTAYTKGAIDVRSFIEQSEQKATPEAEVRDKLKTICEEVEIYIQTSEHYMASIGLGHRSERFNEYLNSKENK